MVKLKIIEVVFSFYFTDWVWSYAAHFGCLETQLEKIKVANNKIVKILLIIALYIVYVYRYSAIKVFIKILQPLTLWEKLHYIC